MSGSVSNLSIIEYIDNGVRTSLDQEAAGFIAPLVSMAFQVISPYLIGAAQSALAGSVLSAGLAYAGGARGSDVWSAAARGGVTAGLTAGVGNVLTNTATAAGATAAASGAANAAGGLAQAASGVSNAVGGTAGGISNTIMNGIRTLVPGANGIDIRRIGAAIVNAAVNGGSMGRLDGLVAQQRAELEALRQSDRSVYDRRINEANKILEDADRMDPAWHARLRMADVAGMEANQFRQAERNIAVRQGGSLDAGQAKAYERGKALHIARSKAKAWNEGWLGAKNAQTQLRTAGMAGLGPDEAGFQNWRADTDILAGQERARREANHSSWGGVVAGLTEQNFPRSTSPDPSASNEDDNPNGFSSFWNGVNNTFGSFGGGS